MICVDHHEIRSGMVERLAKKGIETKVIANQITDYVIDRTRGVERKTVSDFIGSIADGRIFEQANTLRQYFYRPMILLEGGGLYTQKHTARREVIRGTLLWLATNVRVPVVRTYSLEDTAEFLSLLSRQSTAPCWRVEKYARIQPKRNISVQEEQIRMLCAIRGIGRAMAKNILLQFGSIEKIVAGSPKDFAPVHGIGKKRAGHILEVLRGAEGKS